MMSPTTPSSHCSASARFVRLRAAVADPEIGRADIKGRLVVFFPGHLERSNYRLLDARDGWNYHGRAHHPARGRRGSAMKIKDVLQRDPGCLPLGQPGAGADRRQPQRKGARRAARRALDVRVRGASTPTVCRGSSAPTSTVCGKTNQKAAWVSGFFGSGKSHLLKMLCHLWQDTEFPDGATARALVPAMPDELRALLRELDTAGRRGGGCLRRRAPCPAAPPIRSRLTILGILLRAQWVCRSSIRRRGSACGCTRRAGSRQSEEASVEAAGKAFDRELNNLYVSGPIAKALLECDPGFASSEAEARQTLKAQAYPPMARDITTEEFLSTLKEALKLHGRDGRTPCVLLILDEVQQYIGESNDRSVLVTEVAEAVSKQLDSQVMIVGAGQSALTDVPLLHKLLDRFTIRVPLSDAEVEQVTRKVLLHKKPASVARGPQAARRQRRRRSRGNLQGTRIGEVVEDRAVIALDYPLLPVRRRFWENCFRQIDAAGTHSQLRSQLRIIYDAIKKIAGRPLGAVVPGDELFEALAPEMVNTGVLLREINERIIQVGKSDGALAQRVCGLVFLIGKLKRESGADIGVRAKKEHLADLLVEDLTADNGKLRSDVGDVLEKLSKDGVLMQVGDEYRLQTREGSEWDREFRNRQTKLNSDDGSGAVPARPAPVFRDRQDRSWNQADPGRRQGTAPVFDLTRRHAAGHRRRQHPGVDSGWLVGRREADGRCRAQRRRDEPHPLRLHSASVGRRPAPPDRRGGGGTTDPRRQRHPTGDEGREARQSMDSRYAKAAGERDRLVREIVANAKVFQGGGSELIRLTLDEQASAMAPRTRWSVCSRASRTRTPARGKRSIKRARDGADHPFQTGRPCRCDREAPGLHAGDLGDRCRQDRRRNPQGLARIALWLAAGRDRRGPDRTAPVAAHHGHLNGTAIPWGNWIRTRSPRRSSCRARNAVRPGSPAGTKAHDAARPVQERGRGCEGTRVPLRAA
jgi:hypothetical protein